MPVECSGLGVDDAGIKKHVGVFGATSLVGACLLPLLTQAGWQVTAFSRLAREMPDRGVRWRSLPSSLAPPMKRLAIRLGHKTTTAKSEVVPGEREAIPHWVCVAPIWALPDYFSLLEAHGARRIVTLSSTSLFSKLDSNDPAEQALAQRLADAEARLCTWAESRDMEWVILRPTLIYGLGRDKNIAEIAHLIRRFGFFPLCGQGLGLRQPVHVTDVASACFAALTTAGARNRGYNISGAETLPYREMVGRVFAALGRPPRFLMLPLSVFKLALIGLRLFPRYRHWTVAMAERMNRNLVFDHSDAMKEWGFMPKPFEISARDMILNDKKMG